MHLQKYAQKQKIFLGSNSSILEDHYYPKNMSTPKTRKERGSGPSIFITKTYEILQNQEFQDIIKWNAQGTSFLIKDVQKFEQQVLPIYFRHSNYSSFVRQLNMYDFHKIRNEANQNIFEHKEFRRFSRQSLKNIKRKGCTSTKKVGNHEKAAQSYENDQNEDPELIIPSHKTVGNVLMSKATVDNSQTLIKKLISPNNQSSQRLSPTNSPLKRKLIDQILESLPESIQDDYQIENIIRNLKKDPKYSCLNTKRDLKNLVKKIKLAKFNKFANPNDLDDLSIEEEIIVQNVEQPSIRNLSLAIFETEKNLPIKSISLIGSLNFLEDEGALIFPH